MKILLTCLSMSGVQQLVDSWAAYIQHKNNLIQPNNYTVKLQHEDFSKTDYNLTVLLTDINIKKDSIRLVDHYDVVLISNGGEPTAVCNPRIKQILEQNENVLLVTNSYLLQTHWLRDKIIWFPHNIMTCRDFWTRHFYPQYFDLVQMATISRTRSICYINGENRAHRQYFMDRLLETAPDVAIRSTLSSQIIETLDSQWETVEDTEFKHFVNNTYKVILAEDSNNPYYKNSIQVGINNKFGEIPPGYFHLPLYFENSCIVFPETSWQNNELCITEKALKCFYAGSLPLPVAGANVNFLYNEIGFYTAWNLLPPELQEFDSILDHKLRYSKLCEAIKWFVDHPEVFNEEKFHNMTQQNKINFLSCKADYRAVIDFDKILTRFARVIV